MTDINDDTHDLLTKAYIEYYKNNENFEKRKSEKTKRATRRWLSEIRRLASLRRVEVMDSHRAHHQKQDD
jgi:hypothetical protein|tara:strand:- start:1407 stop:1616 length:210 start_codon:yes stop_codon:yes gene_type:complete